MMERLPSNLINEEILKRLDLETVCSVACVNTALRFSVDSQLLPCLSCIDLSQPIRSDATTLRHILSRCSSLNTLILNCQRLHDSSLTPFLSPQIQHLHFSSCSFLSPSFLYSIGQNCPFLRYCITILLIHSLCVFILHYHLVV